MGLRHDLWVTLWWPLCLLSQTHGFQVLTQSCSSCTQGVQVRRQTPALPCHTEHRCGPLVLFSPVQTPITSIHRVTRNAVHKPARMVLAPRSPFGSQQQPPRPGLLPTPLSVAINPEPTSRDLRLPLRISPKLRWISTLCLIHVACLLSGGQSPSVLHAQGARLSPTTMGIGVATAAFMGSLVQSVSGFGFSVIASGPIMAMLGMRDGVVLVSLFSAVIELMLVGPVWRDTLGRCWSNRCVLVSSLLAMPVGVAAISYLQPQLALQIFGITLMATVLFKAVGTTAKPADGSAGARHASCLPFVFGSLSGITAGAFNINGPPLIVYSQLQGWDKHTLRANMLSLFAPLSIGIVVYRICTGAVSWLLTLLMAVSLPAMFLGKCLGSALFQMVDQDTFDKMVQVLIAVMAATLMQG